MKFRTPVDIGSVIRERRRQLKLDQADLAHKIAASRQWVIELERGHPRAELGLVLRALDALGLRLDVKPDDGRCHAAAAIDIDAIIEDAKRKLD